MAIPHFQPNIYRLLAIDPGSNKTGIALFDLDLNSLEILKIQAWTINVNSLRNDTGLNEELFSEPFLRLWKLRKAFYRILLTESIDHVAYEGPFMNRLQPTAYAPLVALQTIIHHALVDYNQGMPFSVFQPQSVKKSVGIAGKKGKEVVMEAVAKHPDIMKALEAGLCELSELDEHAVDAVAVGYTAVKNVIFV